MVQSKIKVFSIVFLLLILSSEFYSQSSCNSYNYKDTKGYYLKPSLQIKVNDDSIKNILSKKDSLLDSFESFMESKFDSLEKATVIRGINSDYTRQYLAFSKNGNLKLYVNAFLNDRIFLKKFSPCKKLFRSLDGFGDYFELVYDFSTNKIEYLYVNGQK